jgi:hypothetical protein
LRLAKTAKPHSKIVLIDLLAAIVRRSCSAPLTQALSIQLHTRSVIPALPPS